MKESHVVLDEVNTSGETVSVKKFLHGQSVVNESISWQRKPFP
jgi:hypothetical protein